MGLLNLFISNVFDIYPSDSFTNQFLSNKSLDVVKILNHNFLKLSLVYSLIWNHIYKTYPTKRDFINFVNIIKVLPETCTNIFDKAFVEKTLNTFMHAKMGMIKHLDTLHIYNTVQTYAVDLETPKFVEEQLYKRWSYRFCMNEPIKVINPGNLLKTFCYVYNAYETPNIYEYQVNPITNNYNEVILFGEDDNTYLTEHEKIQYTMYKDNHMFMKWIDQIGVMFDTDMPKYVCEKWLDSMGTEKYINLINSSYIHDPCYCYSRIKSLDHILPAVFSCFIYVSNTEYPNMKALSINRDYSIYYLYTDKPVKNIENLEIIKSYDRYIVNSIENFNSLATKISKYIILDPLSNHANTYDVLCGPKTYEMYSEEFIKAGYTCTKDLNCKPKYVVDFNKELDLLDYMANGSIPVTNTANLYVKHQITGYVSTNPINTIKSYDTVIGDNIIKNLKYFEIIKSEILYKKLWKQHIELSCPVRTINSRNGMLLYFNFAYLYFIKKFDKIIGLEDKLSRKSLYKIVLLDNRPNPLSVLSVLFTLSNLNMMWSGKIYTSKSGLEYYEKTLGHLVEVVHLPALDVKKFHIDVYNDILKSKDFWESIESEKTLIIQDDGVLLRTGIEHFLEYDYIGASWVDNVANEYIKTHITEDLVGNGGFSLRTNSKMIEVCENFKKEKNWLFYKNITHIPEDVYFIYGLKHLKTPVNIPKYDKGTEFASEEVCHMGSLGVHKVWAYHMSDVTQKYFNILLSN